MYVDNEISELRKVIIHFPDEGISRISPKQAEDLLFDDIVFYPLMNEEYRVFLRVMRTFMGEANVLEVQNLIEEAFDNCEEYFRILIKRIIDFEELPESFSRYFKDMSHQDLSKLLITGYLRNEDRILFDPIPNYMFTRDIAVMIKDHILIAKAAKEARYRENLLSRFIIKFHPMFSEMKEEDRLIDLNNLELFPPSRRGEAVCAEGGDIMMLSPDHILIGCSERSSSYAFQSIKKCLFDKGLVDNVVQFTIPHERSFMHIDTLFTRIDEDAIACYKPVVYDGEGSNVIVYRRSGKTKMYDSIRSFIKAEINANMNYIFSGKGESPYQEREQWTDSCNLVALRPGIAISYDRNLKTLSAFEQGGFRVMDADEFFKYSVSQEDFVGSLERTIITVPSAELSRARGGSHCMTCPLDRK